MFKRSCPAVALAVFLTSVSISRAEVRLPTVFGSHMVLQQGKPLPVWGWATPGETITLSLGNQTTAGRANEKGEFKIILPPQPASATAQSMTVKGSSTVTFDDVLIGEVWVCSGQSNMEMGIKNVRNAEQEIAAANHPNLRLLMVEKAIAATPQKEFKGEWKVCSPESIVQGGWGGFSAAGYFFGRELEKELTVPIGLIDSAWGGTRIEPWTPPEGFANTPSLKSIYEQQQLADPASAARKARVEAYVKELDEWSARAKAAAGAGEPVPPPPAFPAGLNFDAKSPQTPTGLYNAMIHPLIPYAIRGFIWYQGESNHGEGKLYVDKTKAMVEGWRNLWGDQSLPYYFVQIAPYNYGTEMPNVLPEFWEAQAAIPEALPNSGMVVTSDIGEVNDIHPKNKQDVGKRLALLALKNTYGKSEIEASGPVLKSVAPEGSSLIVTFDHGAGLKSKDGKPIAGFELIDAEKGGWMPATVSAGPAENTLKLSAPTVTKPVGVRYAWNKMIETNLVNAAGLPASAFRGGEIPKRDALSMNVPEAGDYRLVYDIDLSNLQPVKYAVDNHASAGSFSRVAYFLEVGDAFAPQYVWVSMDAFTNDAGKIGIPTYASGADFQQPLSNLTVVSNVPGVARGMGIKAGQIEFWPNNYGQSNAAKVPGASSSTFDFGDEKTEPRDGYGSMQIHNLDAKQTVFAFNHWNDPAPDLGIGNQPKDNPDWTFSKSAPNYAFKRLRVFVK